MKTAQQGDMSNPNWPDPEQAAARTRRPVFHGGDGTGASTAARSRSRRSDTLLLDCRSRTATKNTGQTTNPGRRPAPGEDTAFVLRLSAGDGGKRLRSVARPRNWEGTRPRRARPGSFFLPQAIKFQAAREVSRKSPLVLPQQIIKRRGILAIENHDGLIAEAIDDSRGQRVLCHGEPSPFQNPGPFSVARFQVTDPARRRQMGVELLEVFHQL